MHIESLEITNFKSIEYLQMDDIPNLVVIAGPNGAGKTSIFDAIRIFKESMAPYSVRNPGAVQVANLLSQVGPVIRAGASEATIRITFRITERERELISMPQERGLLLAGTATIRRSNGYNNPEQAFSSEDYGFLGQLLGGRYRLGGELGFIDHIGPQRIMNAGYVTAIDLSPDATERDLQGLVLNSAGKFSNLSQDLVMMRFADMEEKEREDLAPHHYIDGVRQIFRHFLPNTELLRFDLARNLSGPIQIRVRSGSVEHDLNQLSSGQKEILMTYTHLERLRPSGSIILFDEPELHLHPALQRRVIAYLQNLLERSSNQIWVVTHSEEIVGTTTYESLFAMKGGSPAISPAANQADRLELLAQLGANIGLQLLSPRILFVEGESDEDLLHQFFDTLPSGLSIVSTGGKGTLMRLTATAMRLLDDAVREGQFYFVRDHDVEDEPGKLDDLARKYEGHFFTWDRYHIENYLLDEEAISAVLADDPGFFEGYSPAVVLGKLRSIADSMRADVIAQHLEAELNPRLRERLRLNPRENLHISLKKAISSRLVRMNHLLQDDNIEQTYRDVCADIQRRWDMEWRNLSIGRNVLQEFHKQHVRPHLGYEVFRNRIARKMREHERVPAAIVRVIESVIAELPPNIAE